MSDVMNSWSISSKKDPRWNASGRCVSNLTAVGDACSEAIAKLIAQFGDLPDDLECGGMGDTVTVSMEDFLNSRFRGDQVIDAYINWHDLVEAVTALKAAREAVLLGRKGGLGGEAMAEIMADFDSALENLFTVGKR